MHRISPAPGPRSARGTVLFVALVLLLLAGLLTLFALKIGAYEQRSTGNDMRSKVVVEVAEAGLAQAFEFLIRQQTGMLENPALWERCNANDTTFPCGAISAGTFDDDGDPATPEVSRRGSMFRLRAVDTNVIPNLDLALSQHMLALPASSKIAAMGNGMPVAYGVAPVVCFASEPTGAGSGIPCGAVGGTSVAIATFVSVARMPGENASSTLVQTVGSYPRIPDDLIGKPPITTSGSAGVNGTLQVVTNPNAGGPGVPVSVWTRIDVDKTGTTNTCYADEFFRYTVGNAVPTIYQNTIRCDSCRCDATSAPTTLSYDSSGINRCTGPSADCEGMDILDVDTGTDSRTGYNAGGHEGANYNVRSDRWSYPTCEFPPDLFRYVFGVTSWNDTNNDCFAETKAGSVIYQNPDNAQGVGAVGPDEAYLYKIADRIIPTEANRNLVKVSQLGTSALLASANSSGIIWCQTNCDISSNNQVGTPENPVLLILDGPVRIQGIVYGFVFVRDTGNTLRPETGGSLAGACPNDCMLQFNAGSAIYGGLVVQGQIKSNGTSAVIYNGDVLREIVDDAGLLYATLPGAWSDQRSF